jgi:hypothetical protein
MLSRRSLPGATRSSEDFGILWRAAEPSGAPLIVLLTARPATLAWVASSLASSLPAVVAVIRVSFREGDVAAARECAHAVDLAIDAASQLAVSLKADPARLGLVADGPAAHPALLLAAARTAPRLDAPPRVPVSRLALIAPVLELPAPLPLVPPAFPPTLVQFAREGATAVASRALATKLSSAGVAVRATDYESPRDGWATRSRAVRRSQRGADDLVGFFARGFGASSTFHVIPGWDLH